MSITKKLVERFDSDKQFVFSDSDPFKDVTNWISVGSPTLEMGLETLGFPTGIIEVRGPSKAGKTTISLHAMKSILDTYPQQAVVSVLSSERRDNMIYAKSIGVKTDEVIIHKVRNIKQVFLRIAQVIKETDAVIEKLPKEEQFVPKFLFIWDSLGGTISEAEMKTADENVDKDKSKAPAMASAARELAEGMRYMVGLIYDRDVCFIIINHTYDGMNGGGKVSYGGNKIEFMPTMRLDVNFGYPTKTVYAGSDENKRQIGQIVDITPIKNDFSSRKEKITIEIGFGYGIVLCQNDIDFAISEGILEKYDKSGAKFLSTAGKVLIQWRSRGGLYELYEARNPYLKVLQKKIMKAAQETIIKNRAEKLEKLKKG